MLILDILQIPIEFIKENLTGWVLLILIVFMIYFICLRKYFTPRLLRATATGGWKVVTNTNQLKGP